MVKMQWTVPGKIKPFKNVSESPKKSRMFLRYTVEMNLGSFWNKFDG